MRLLATGRLFPRWVNSSHKPSAQAAILPPECSESGRCGCKRAGANLKLAKALDITVPHEQKLAIVARIGDTPPPVRRWKSQDRSAGEELTLRQLGSRRGSG